MAKWSGAAREAFREVLISVRIILRFRLELLDLVCEYCPSGPEQLEMHFAMVWLDLVREYCPSGPAWLERYFARFCFSSRFLFFCVVV